MPASPVGVPVGLASEEPWHIDQGAFRFRKVFEWNSSMHKSVQMEANPVLFYAGHAPAGHDLLNFFDKSRIFPAALGAGNRFKHHEGNVLVSSHVHSAQKELTAGAPYPSSSCARAALLQNWKNSIFQLAV